MILKILVPMGGPDGNWTNGDQYECDDASGRRLIAAGRAELWKKSPVERAVAAPPETAAAAGGGKRMHVVPPKAKRKTTTRR